jgi:beta-lactamase class A
LFVTAAALTLTLAAAAASAPTPVPPLQASLQAIARSVDGRVGCAVMLLETGEHAAIRGDEAFPTQSVYKIPIAMAAMTEATRAGRPLAAKVRVLASDVVAGPYPSPTRALFRRGVVDVPLRDLVRHAIAQSDNTASDALLRLAGGPKAVNAYMAGIGITGFAVATPIGSFVPHRNTATPRATVSLLAKLHAGGPVTAEARGTLLEAMAACETGPARLPALLPRGTAVAHKTGTAGTYGGVTPATNDVGYLTLPDGRHVAIAAFLADSRADEAARDRTIARLAKAAWDTWAR